MRRFEYLAPRNLAEALAMLADRKEVIPLAGGTDLLVQIKEAQRPVKALLSLKRVPELRRRVVNGGLTLGSMVTLARIAADPRIRRDYAALAQGVDLIGSVQIRNVATLGGNLCSAVPSADTAPALLALGARTVIASASGERTVPLEAFFLGPERTVLLPGELLKEVVVPQPPEHSGSCYLRHTARARMDIAVVGVAAAVALAADGTIAAARLALGAVAPVPMRAGEAEALLSGQSLTEELLSAAGAAAARAAEPIDDQRASAEYRRHLVDVLIRLRSTANRSRSPSRPT
jgi:CO/xanthine dehydrogenase FAD-binding subunit